jgi:hypothetical protein
MMLTTHPVFIYLLFKHACNHMIILVLYTNVMEGVKISTHCWPLTKDMLLSLFTQYIKMFDKSGLR